MDHWILPWRHLVTRSLAMRSSAPWSNFEGPLNHLKWLAKEDLVSAITCRCCLPRERGSAHYYRPQVSPAAPQPRSPQHARPGLPRLLPSSHSPSHSPPLSLSPPSASLEICCDESRYDLCCGRSLREGATRLFPLIPIVFLFQ